MVSALVHLYRGEVNRADGWRARLDTTTNWALTTAAAVISFGLGSSTASHAVLLIGMFMVLNFLLIESRRYRHWDLYLRRVRLLETALYVPMLRQDPPDFQALRELASMLEMPRIKLLFWQSMAQRIKRAYGPVFGVLLASWLLKLSLQMHRGMPVPEAIDLMHISYLPGWAVLVIVTAFYLALGALTLWGISAAPPETELLAAPHPRRRTLKAALIRPLMRRQEVVDED